VDQTTQAHVVELLEMSYHSGSRKGAWVGSGLVVSAGGLQRGLWGCHRDFGEGCFGEVSSQAVGCLGDGCCWVIHGMKGSMEKSKDLNHGTPVAALL